MTNRTALPETAVIASPGRVLRGVTADGIGWFGPWVLIGVAFALFPTVAGSPWWVALLIFGAALYSGISLAIDVYSLQRNGFSIGFAKHELRVVDPAKDHLVYMARSHHKSVRKLLKGQYLIVDVRHAHASGRVKR